MYISTLNTKPRTFHAPSNIASDPTQAVASPTTFVARDTARSTLDPGFASAAWRGGACSAQTGIASNPGNTFEWFRSPQVRSWHHVSRVQMKRVDRVTTEALLFGPYRGVQLQRVCFVLRGDIYK
jgi:hypothetical protein